MLDVLPQFPLVYCLEDSIGHQLKASLEHEGSTHGGEDEGGRPPEDILVDFPDYARHLGREGARRPTDAADQHWQALTH